MANPYEPSTATTVAPVRRDWDRDACPYCLHKQGLWKALSPIRQYRCKRCGQPLFVALPRGMIRTLATCGILVAATYFLYRFIYGMQPMVGGLSIIVLVISLNFLLRFPFGYFHPVSRNWLVSRTELTDTQIDASED